MKFNGEIKGGVTFLHKQSESTSFEQLYVALREKEERILSDEEVKALPYLSIGAHVEEWKLRAETAQRYRNYLTDFKGKTILEIGCGNGWFSNFMAQSGDFEVVAQDVNVTELKQASHLFPNSNIQWVFTEDLSLFPKAAFNLIVFNASIQYFPDIVELLNTVTPLLTANGEIHVLDSPVYSSEKEAESAKQRTVDYYTSMGFSALSANYNHHTRDNFKAFEQLYKPSIWNKFKGNRNPFPWLRFQK